MSAFVVSERTMHSVVAALHYKNRYGQIVRSFAGLTIDDKGTNATAIGRILYSLNIEAVMQRYRDEGSDSASLATAYVYKRPKASGSVIFDLIGGIKQMRCLSYQCSEGDVPDSAMFKEYEAATLAVALQIIQMLPEYEAAAWGIG